MTKLFTEDIYYVGVLDKDLKVFDIIMTTEKGTTYNSFLVKGKEKTALIESVKTPFFEEHLNKIRQICHPSDIDYLVVNHTEPDHSGAIEKFLEFAPNAQILASNTAISFLKEIINKPFAYRAVTEKDTIDLGGMSLSFIIVPMLHWPDTMFTYIKERKALFPCDCFGCHYADDNIFNDLIGGDFLHAYKYYFDNIIAPYKKPFMVDALEKIKDLDIKFIGTGHGPVLRKNVDKYIDMYRNWCKDDKTDKKKAVIAYVSAYGYTKSLGEKIKEGLLEGGADEVKMFDLVFDKAEDALKAISEAHAIIIGSPTMVGDTLPPITALMANLNPVIHKGIIAAAFGSYGWSGEAVPNIMGRFKQLRLKTPLEGLKVRLKPTNEDLNKAYDFGKELSSYI